MKLSKLEEKLLPEEVFLNRLISGEIDFQKLSGIYIEYLETEKTANRELIAELAVVSASYKEKGLWQGTKKELEDKYNKAQESAGVLNNYLKSAEGKGKDLTS